MLALVLELDYWAIQLRVRDIQGWILMLRNWIIQRGLKKNDEQFGRNMLRRLFD